MTLGGLVIMILSVGGTTAFFAWCIRRILRQPDQTRKLHGVLDTELEIELEEKRRRLMEGERPREPLG
jgi:hypothetical protein